MSTNSAIETKSNGYEDPFPFIDRTRGTSYGIQALVQKTFVVKLGGSTLEHQRAILQDIVQLHTLGAKVVLVHGGGPYINAWLQKLAIPVHFEQGLRVTDTQTLEVVRMVLCGHINQQLVAMVSQIGGKAVGLCGTDDHMVQAHIADEKLGLVGTIDNIDATVVVDVLEKGYIPIIAPLGLSVDGHCLNINADQVAAHIARALHADRLVFLSNVNGICQADGSLIPEIHEGEAHTLIDRGVICGGMIPKVQAGLDALVDVPCVHIVNGNTIHILLSELEEKPGVGTFIVR
jgi:acetylglutamate kinase